MTSKQDLLKVSDPQLHNPEEVRLSKATAQTILTCLGLVERVLPLLEDAPDVYINEFEMFRTRAIMYEILDSDTEMFNDNFPWKNQERPRPTTQIGNDNDD